MSIIRRLSDLPTNHERAIGRDSGDLFGWNAYVGSTIPAANIIETNDSFEIDLAAPGYRKEDFKIELHHNILKISSDKVETEPKQDVNYTKHEFNFGNWERVFTLPNTVLSDNIEAHYADGLLNLIIPKKEEAKIKPPKTIEIR